jgi:hypothetical protein
MIREIFRGFGAVIDRGDRKGHGTVFTAGEKNVRVPILVLPQNAPDPERQGAIPARPAMNQVATFTYDMGWSFGAEDFTWGENAHVTGELASMPYGRQMTWDERSNIAPPQHMAYGSLFQFEPTVYYN